MLVPLPYFAAMAVVLFLVRAGDLLLLVIAHALIALQERLHRGFHAGSDQVNIVGELIQEGMESLEVLLIFLGRIVLNLLDRKNARLLQRHRHHQYFPRS